LTIARQIGLWIAHLLLAPTPAVADHVYGWLDEQGNVQFSDRPPGEPPEQGYLEPVPPTVEERIEKAELDRWRKRLAEFEAYQAKAREVEARRQVEEEMRQRYCGDAHAHLIYFSYPGRQYVRKGHSGAWTTVDSEERAALIAHWQKMVDELCE
jgi:hypothetical protein